MDDDLRSRLFDPSDTHALVLARRPDDCPAVTAVVSDVVWRDVVQMLRWAAASTGAVPELDTGRWWRLAAGCADLLRRLPALSDEAGEDWAPSPEVAQEDEADGTLRVQRCADRLLRLLLAAGPVPLRSLAGEVDALGAAAISALAGCSTWVVPGPQS